MARAATAQTKADMRRQAAREAREASRRAEAAEIGVQRRMAKMREAQLEKELAEIPDQFHLFTEDSFESGAQTRLRATTTAHEDSHVKGLGSPTGISIASGAVSPTKALRELQNRPRQVKLSIMEEFRRELEEIDALKEVLRERYYNEFSERLEEGRRAAVEIQRIIRAKQARTRVERIIAERAEPVYGPEHHLAVTKLQAQYRRRAVGPIVEVKREERDRKRKASEEKRKRKKELRKQAAEKRQIEEDAAIETQQRTRIGIKAQERREMAKDIERQKKVTEEMRREAQKRAEAEARTLQGARKRYAAEMANEMEIQHINLHEQIAKAAAPTSVATIKLAQPADQQVKGSLDTRSHKGNVQQASPVAASPPQQLSPAPSVDEDIPVSPAALPVEESRIEPSVSSEGERTVAPKLVEEVGLGDDGGDNVEVESEAASSIPDIEVIDAVPRLDTKASAVPVDAALDDDSDDDSSDGLAGLLELAKQTKKQASARLREEKDDDCNSKDGFESKGNAGREDESDVDEDEDMNVPVRRPYGARPESKEADSRRQSGFHREEPQRDEEDSGTAETWPKRQPLVSPPSSVPLPAAAAAADYEDDFEDLDEIAI